jgi:transcriptional regulator with XRE-family HTH domain
MPLRQRNDQDQEKGVATSPRQRHHLLYESVKSVSTSKKTCDDTASRVRQARERRRLKQVELAGRAGLQPSAISQFENGQREPSPENLCKLADALGVTVDYLLGRDKPQPAGPQIESVVRHAQEMDQGTLDELERFAKFLAEKDKRNKSVIQAQVDMLKAMAHVAALLQAWKKRIETGILEAGLVLMVNDALRKAYLTNSPMPTRQRGRHYSKLLDWMPLAVNQLLSKDSIKIDPKSPEGLPFYLVGPSPFDLTDLGSYVRKAEEAVKVIKKIGEKKARTEVEECIDDPSILVPT